VINLNQLLKHNVIAFLNVHQAVDFQTLLLATGLDKVRSMEI